MSALDIDITHLLGGFVLKVTCQLPKGITAIVGPSGAGKTSLLRALAGFNVPDRGRIMCGEQIWFDSTQKLHIRPEDRNVAMVFQTPKLLPHLNVAQNINLAPHRRLKDNAAGQGLLQKLGLQRLLNRRVHNLSGGEKQRVMLARALVSQPHLLLFDEPLSALAPDQRRQLGALIRQVCAQLDVPVLFVTHSFEEAARLADHFMYLNEGEVVASGTVEDLFVQLAQADLPVSDLIEFGLGASLDVKPAASRQMDDLLALDLDGQTLMVPLSHHSRMPSNVRIWARDVILSLTAPSGLSARNCLKVKIEDIVLPHQDKKGGPVLIVLRLQQQRFFATITTHALDELALQQNQMLYALIKSIALEPDTPINA